ncbi:hypothetical protein FF125_16615 [Aureibaculum algae]|uniref:Helicase/UvrB N-terminal domain-containing protein n=1 Tax=Aureibaculum algae TaxID=2584122 RepID=A0A5B7TX93_9FLAO|nr:DEAD/DEAH box helicase family protein [Aureibaculum algae]QCX39983.1 hypothetical protein FF125_16615 [Aureibaculum algae]
MQTNLFKDLRFIYPWRNYQENFLINFSTHISDDHFHVIAPPGSGKTVLGLEIVKRIGKKTLVLAPTLTIRNQWEDRLQHFFTKEKNSERSHSILNHSLKLHSPPINHYIVSIKPLKIKKTILPILKPMVLKLLY